MSNSHFDLSILPIGGLKEIGANTLLIENNQTGVIVDCGILFPDDDHYEINYLIPDYSKIDFKKFNHLILTHGHEDHIGAIRHVIQLHPDIQIITTELTQKLVMRKCNNTALNFRIVKDEDEITIGDIKILFFALPHSIPSVLGAAFKHKSTTVSLMTDFKLNHHKDEKPVNFKLIDNFIKDSKVRLGLIDSTNISSKSMIPSEDDLLPELEDIIQKKKNLLLTLFPSNIQRIKNIFDLCKKAKKRIVPVGRSVENMINLGLEMGILSDENLTLYDEFQPSAHLGNVCFIISGCQGDFKSALRRIAQGTDPKIKISAQSTVVFSSKIIPGNENNVYRLYNLFAEQGAEIITAYERLIHCSGHPSQVEIREVCTKLQFTHILPIHGETYYLNLFKNFLEQNFPKLKCHLIFNGDRLVIKNDIVSEDLKYYPSEMVLIHGQDLPISKDNIRERRKISQGGLIVISFTSNMKIHYNYAGVPIEYIDQEKVNSIVMDKYESFKNKKSELMCEEMRNQVRTYLNGVLGYKPVVLINYLI